MNLETFSHILEHPEAITATHGQELEQLLERYPFFQPARALYLKSLKEQESPKYNKELKRTASCTVDRSILFDFITSSVFHQHAISNTIKSHDKLSNINVSDAIDVTHEIEEEEIGKAHTVMDPDFFIRKNQENDEKSAKTEAKEVLKEGKPLDFDKKETHSFSEWLKITAFSPINHSEEKKPSEHISSEQEELPPERKRKIRLIDQFIANNPKIKIKAKDEQQPRNVPDLKNVPDEHLMTETLARVYIEQKNYKKAKQAYKILSLKYPEKSGFFADQIRAIEELQDFKN